MSAPSTAEPVRTRRPRCEHLHSVVWWSDDGSTIVKIRCEDCGRIKAPKWWRTAPAVKQP